MKYESSQEHVILDLTKKISRQAVISFELKKIEEEKYEHFMAYARNKKDFFYKDIFNF